MTPPLDIRDHRYWLYVIVTCALPAAAAVAVVIWRPPWAWWALAAELAVITVLTVTWRALRARRHRGPPS
jgi:membrane protein implicated in regulation of membrane protease activity